MFAIKFSKEKGIRFIWMAGFFLPAINATVFSNLIIRLDTAQDTIDDLDFLLFFLA